MKTKKRIVLVCLVLAMIVVSQVVLAACSPSDNTPLVLQTSTMDGVFNPFFASSAYDTDVNGLIISPLLTSNDKGEVVWGDQYHCIAKDVITSLNNATGEATYEIVLKNGLKFSDGKAITADDVLFNYYVYLDPAYTGSTTMYSLPIKGLTPYRNQDSDPAATQELVDQYSPIIAESETFQAGKGYTEAQHNAFWKELNKQGPLMTEEIKAKCMSYAGTVPSGKTQTYAEIEWGMTKADITSKGLEWAWGMYFWGFGEISEADATKFDAVNGEEYSISALNADVYWKVLKEHYDGDALSIDGEAAAGVLPVEESLFMLGQSLKKAGVVSSISGITKGTKKIDGITYETVTVVATEQSPKTILQLGASIVSKDYYTKGFSYNSDAVITSGVQLGLNEDGSKNSEFMDHLKTLNGAPMGSGPYKMDTNKSHNGFYSDEVVYFTRNDNFECFGFGNANIKLIRMKVIAQGQELAAVKNGEVHYANPSATGPVMTEIASLEKITDILVDNLGYGYICVNPRIHTNLHERIAINSVFDLDEVYNYYPSGLADVIYRSMSQVSWAYPTGVTEAMYAYDSTGAKALAEYQLAGYTLVDGKLMKDGKQAQVTMTLPSDAADHPAGGIFLKAKTILEKIGVKADVVTDANLIAKTKSGSVGCYALAWQAAIDPDMFQTTSYKSQADSVIGNGIKWLQANGASADLGTIEWEGQTLTQRQALEALADLIDLAVKKMTPTERAPIYEQALALFAKLSIEIPTYQRKNLIVYDNTVIDASSLSETVTPYWGPMAEIWNVKFAEGFGK